MSGQRIFAVNHDRREVMKIGHTDWDKEPEAPIEDRIKFFAPFNERGKEQFFTRATEFQIQELINEDAVAALNYTRARSYWNTVGA